MRRERVEGVVGVGAAAGGTAVGRGWTVRDCVGKFEDIIVEIEKAVTFFCWMDELHVELKGLIDDRKFMCAHKL